MNSCFIKQYGKTLKNLYVSYYDNRAIIDVVNPDSQDTIRIDFDTNLKNISIKKNDNFIGSVTLS